MTDLNLLSFGLTTPQSSDKSATTSTGGDGEAGFAALLAAQWATDAPAAGEYVDEPAVDVLPTGGTANQSFNGAGKESQFFSNACEITQANSFSAPRDHAGSNGYAYPKIAEGAQPESILIQSIGRSLANKESPNTGALRLASPPVQAATNNAAITSTAFGSEGSAEAGILSTLAQFTNQQPDALNEGFISRHVKSLVGRILALGRPANDSIDARASEPAVAQSADLADAHIEPNQNPGEAVFRVPPSGGSGGFSRTARLLNEPFPPEGGTLNARHQTPESDQLEISAKLLDWNPLATSLVMIPPAARPVLPVPETAPSSSAQDKEAMSTAQTAQVPFAEFYILPVMTPRNYESTPGTLAARAQSLFKALDQQPTDKPPVRFTPAQQLGAPSKESMQGIQPASNGTASTFSENVRQAASLSDNAAPRFSLFQDVIANDMNGSLEKGSTNFSLSEFPNDPAFEANDKLKFVEPRTARFSEVSASADARPGVSTPELSLNPEWLKTEVSQLQDERISSYASNSDSYPAQDEEAMSTAQTAQVPFAEFYTLPVATPGNYESTPGTRAARAQSLFKTLDQQPTDKPPVRFTPGQQLGALPVMAPGKESMQGIPPVSGETTSAFSENVRQAASLSELPNERAFEANDKPEFVEPRAARFSEVGVGVATPELSLNPEWSKTVDAPPQTENLSVPANLSSSLSIDQMPSLAETRTEVRPVQPDADNGFRDEMPRPVARHIEADAQDFGNVPDQQPVNEPLARTDFAGTLEPGIFAPDAQQSLAGDAATVERVPVLPTLTRQQAEVSSIAPSGRDDQLASEPANVQRPFGTQNGNPSGNASGIEIEYSELLPQGSEAAPVVASSPAESKESLPQATTIANEEAILFGARGPRFERDELRLRNMTAAQSATASPAESKESFTSAAPLSGIEQDQVERVAPQHDLSAFSTGVSRRATGDSSVRAVQPEESFEPALMASRNIENVEQASSPRESGQIEVSPTLLEEKPAKVGRRGEAAVDKADTDLSAPAANNAAVSKMAGAKLEEPNATVRHLTPPLIEASESLTPGKPHTLRLNLRPVDLGPVEIQITRDANGHLNAHLTVEREVAGQTLSEGIPQLREALERAGLQVDRLVVSINTGGNGEGQARHPDAQQFTPTSEPDFFETDPGHIGGEAAEDRLLNLHA